MARRTVAHASRRTGQVTAPPPPSPEGFAPPWLLGLAVIGAGLAANAVWGQDVQVAVAVASSLTFITVTLAALTWQYATPRSRLTPRQKLVRWHAVGTVAVSGCEALALLAYGLTRGTVTACGFVSFAVAVSWNIPRFQAIRDIGLRESTDDTTAAALGIDGAHARMVHEDDDKVITRITPALGQSYKDVQQHLPDALATAANAPLGGVRAVIDPNGVGAVDMIRMKRNVLENPVPWPGPSDLGGSFAAALRLGRREDGTDLLLNFVGCGGDKPRAATHLLMQGIPGAGKGEAFRTTALEILTRRDVLLWLFDKTKPHQTARGIGEGCDLFVTQLADIGQILAGIRRLIPHRSKRMGDAGFDQWAEGAPVPAIVCWFEECADIFGSDVEWLNHFNRLAEQCRSVGIWLVFSLQRAHGENIPTNVRNLLGSGWCFGSPDPEFCLSSSTLEAGADPGWGTDCPGLSYLESPGVPRPEWSMKVRSAITTQEQRLRDVALGEPFRCKGLDDHEAAVIGPVYARLHKTHLNPTHQEVAVADTLLEDGPEFVVPPQPEPEDQNLDPRVPLPADDVPEVSWPGLNFDTRDLSKSELYEHFGAMLQAFADAGTSVLTMDMIYERWPYRKRPWIVEALAYFVGAGQLARVQTSPGEPGQWEIVALVTAAGVTT